MFKFYETADTLIEEQNQFETDIKEYVTGHINPIKFKAIRVAHGVYEQRQNDTYMVRIRCAAGGITPIQLKKVAEMAEKYGSGDVHFTTRCEVQIHDVIIDDVMKAIRGLYDVGLSSRGGGGNTIRNILTSPNAGLLADDVFDVDPYAIALTTRLIQEPDSWNLPRKFKIAFSSGPSDTAYVQTTCLGYVAKIKDGVQGFEVYCAGGMGAKPMVGHKLLDFVPGEKSYQVARAMKTMFDKHGNRKKKTANRLKFLWKKLERDEFTQLFNEEFDKIKDNASLDLEIHDLPQPKTQISIEPESVNSDAFKQWKARFAIPQKQSGLFTVKLALELGDLRFNDAYVLTEFLDQIGDNTIRCDRGQNMWMRNIPEALLGNLYTIVNGLEQTLAEHAYFISNMVNCTGASTCKLGICLPRGLSSAITERLAKSNLALDSIPDFKLNMSGCPNTCGMHHVADLGFFGKVGRNEGNLYPMYNILAGAEVEKAGETKYAEKVSEISAKYVPDFVHDYLEDYIAKKEQYSTYKAYLEAEGKDLINKLTSTKYNETPSLEQDESFYTDFGAKKRLSLDELGTAECSAGMFDMIDVDKKSVRDVTKALEKGEGDEAENCYQLLFSASRMLLVTRGLDAKTDEQVFDLFNKHFVGTDLVSSQYNDLVVLGKLALKSELPKYKDRIIQLGSDMVELYGSMDDSLRFSVEKKEDENKGSDSVTGASVEKDFRGVACPMNFVKTKLVLETMTTGQTLQILLDDGEPIENVPNSVKNEGHKVLDKSKADDGHWSVLIQKA